MLRRADSHTLYVEQSIAPIVTEGIFSGVVVILRDVSERRRSEAALRSSERLSLLGRLAATIAHEIRNPLDAVMNLIYLLRTSTRIDEAGRSFVLTAEEELKRIAQITHQLLAFNRESTKPVETDVSELFDGVLKLFAPKITSAGITIRPELNETELVVALPGELRQVFSNLIANAIDVLQKGGVIAIKVSNAQEYGIRGREGVRITVADNGPGIPEAVQESLFTPFFTTKGEKGTGLGLWVSRGIVTKHEGTMQLRSATEGSRRGTVFSIFLPLRPESQALQSPAA
jgi:signal transduction histidine kinase